jgi:hypothetical protein
MLLAQIAGATHPRPKGATPIRASVVPAHKQCANPNRTHGAPLAFPSCNPPVQTSSFLTVGSPDANGAGANSNGFVLITVDAVPPEDVLIKTEITDVRCKAGTAASVCNSPNGADGADYSGQLQSNAMIRMTDHYNGPGLDETATVQDIPFPVSMDCVNTGSTTIGGTCSVDTSTNALRPGFPRPTGEQRAVVELQQLQVFDGGSDGQVATADNALFAVQGIFIP